ncbi:MAG: FtsX-like permease family protein, partial [Actinomycetia bacterium]|nr:FtsX-like permease family protein [Actinomycetes bacterium]
MQKMLFVFASIALMVAALVIANTLAIVFAQRTRDFALLRCIGAKRAQITRSVLIETTVVAVIAAVLGVFAGLGLAYAGAALANAVWPAIPIGTPSLSPSGVATPTLVAIGVALAAALVPARRANRLSPLAALRPDAEPEGRTVPGLVRIGAASLFLLVGFGALAYASTSGSLPVGMAGGGVSFVGIVLMGPILVPGLIDAVRPLAGKLGGVPGRLAAANAVRHRRRTAATSAALLIGVTLISTVIVGTASMKAATAKEMDTRAPIDMVLNSDRPLPAATAVSVAKIDGVDAVAALDGTRVRLGATGAKAVAVGVDAPASDIVRPAGDLRNIADSEVFVPLAVASDASLADGDRIRVVGPDGTRRLKVVTGDEWGSTVTVSARTLRRLDDTTKAYSVWLRADEDADAGTVVGELNALADSVDGSIDGSLPQRAQVMSALDMVLAVTVGLLGVAVVIAIVGVGNTLSLSVLERVRENALLRALGLRRSQQRSMLAVEALLIASVAGAIGIALGVAYAWFGVRTLAVEEFVTAPSVEIPVGQLIAVFVVAAVAGLLACVLPARRAAKIPPAAGLVAD